MSIIVLCNSPAVEDCRPDLLFAKRVCAPTQYPWPSMVRINIWFKPIKNFLIGQLYFILVYSHLVPVCIGSFFAPLRKPASVGILPKMIRGPKNSP